MSYTPTQWSAGDTVTSAKLNKIEQGITNNNVLEVHETYSDNPQYSYILDKTWQEIHDAMPFVYIYRDTEYTNTRWLVIGAEDNGADSAYRYRVYTNGSASQTFATSSPDGNPGIYDQD